MNENHFVPLFGNVRRLLAFDASTCLAMGLLLCAGSQALSGPLGLASSFLFWVGVMLLACAALIAACALPRSTPPVLLGLIVAGNIGWVLASVVVATVVLAPTALGAAFILIQAATVLGLAILEYRALRVASPTPGFAS